MCSHDVALASTSNSLCLSLCLFCVSCQCKTLDSVWKSSHCTIYWRACLIFNCVILSLFSFLTHITTLLPCVWIFDWFVNVEFKSAAFQKSLHSNRKLEGNWNFISKTCLRGSVIGGCSFRYLLFGSLHYENENKWWKLELINDFCCITFQTAGNILLGSLSITLI